MTQKRSHRLFGGYAAQGSVSGMGFARGLTSHLRHHYEQVYKTKYRRPNLIFAIDVTLFALASSLVVAGIWFYTLPPAQAPDMKLTLVAPPIETATPLAVELKVVSEGDKPHEHVELFWELPEGVHILQATPSIGEDGSVAIGHMEPGEEVKIDAVMEVLTDAPSLTFHFRVHDDSGTYSGVAVKSVRGSGLTAEPLLNAESISSGASVPYRLVNTTPLDFTNIRIRATGDAQIQEQDALEIQHLPSLGERTFFFRPAKAGDGFEVYLGDTRLYRVSPDFHIAANDLWKQVDVELAPSTGSSTTILVDTPQPIELFVYHPGLRKEGHVQTFDVDADVDRVPLTVDRLAEGSEWFVVPLLRLNDRILIGPTSVGAITTNFDVGAQARFYSRDGDQIGVGSLPPQVGEEITYWIFVTLEPTTADIRDFQAEVRLPKGVEPTGNRSLPFGGELSMTNDRAAWSVDYLPRSEDRIYAGFEVSVTPKTADVGAYVPLVDSWKAQAVEIRSEEPLHDEGGALDSALPEDTHAAGKGRVIR